MRRSVAAWLTSISVWAVVAFYIKPPASTLHRCPFISYVYGNSRPVSIDQTLWNRQPISNSIPMSHAAE